MASLNPIGKFVDGAVNSAVSVIFGTRQAGKIGLLELDATITEDHIYSNTVSSFPVEDGSDVSDHVRQEPEQISITGIVTKSPVSFLGGIIGSGAGSINRKGGIFQRGKGSGNDRVQEALESLLSNMGYDFPEQGGTTQRVSRVVTPIQIVTGLRIYSDMIIVRLSIPRDKDTGAAIQVNLTAKKIRFVKTPFEINTFVPKNLSGTPSGNKDGSAGTIKKGTVTGDKKPVEAGSTMAVKIRDFFSPQ